MYTVIVVANSRIGEDGLALKAQILQPRRNIHAVILGSEERQPLMNDDTVNDRF